MTRLFGVLTLTVLFAASACSSEDMCDPTGNWSLSIAWGAGDCGIPGVDDVTLTVTEGPDSFLIASSDPSTSIVGTITTDEGLCRMSVTEVNSDVFDDGGSSTGTVAYNIEDDGSGIVTGSGSISISGTVNCSQAFSVAGTH